MGKALASETTGKIRRPATQIAQALCRAMGHDVTDLKERSVFFSWVR